MDAALFHYQRGEYLPAPDSFRSDTDENWSAIREAEKKNMLCGDPPLTVNDEHPKIQKTVTAIEKLTAYMNENEDILRPLLENEYKCTYYLGDEDFWNQVTRY